MSPQGASSGMDRGAATLHHVLHPGAEDAVDADDDFVARLDQVGGDALHARHAGAADGEGERVLRAEDLAQQLAGLVHDGDILRVEMADGRRRQRAQNALGHGAGAGAKQDAFGGMCGGGRRSSQLHKRGYRWPGGKASRIGGWRRSGRAAAGSKPGNPNVIPGEATGSVRRVSRESPGVPQSVLHMRPRPQRRV